MTEIRLDVEPDEPDGTAADSPGPARSGWIAAYAVAVLALAVAVVSFIDIVGGDPDDVVHDYLSAINGGDTAEALQLATAKPKRDDPRDVFLRAGALSANWRITSVETRGHATSKAIVDASITGPDGPRDGVFRLERTRTGEWRITNPFVPLYLTPPPVWKDGDRERVRLSLNGVTVTAPDYEPAVGVSESAGIQLRLFPGTYAFFEDDALVKPVDASRTWLPHGDDSSFVPYTPWLELTGKAARLADDRIGEVLRDCENQSARQPDGCPFGTDEKVSLDGDEHAIDADAANWTYDGEPELSYADTGLGYFQPVERRRMTVELTVTVAGETRSVDCFVDWATLGFGLSTDAGLAFSEPYDSPDTCP